MQNQDFKLGALFRALGAPWGTSGALCVLGGAKHLPQLFDMPRDVPLDISADIQLLKVGIGAQGHFFIKLMDRYKNREKDSLYMKGLRAREFAPRPTVASAGRW